MRISVVVPTIGRDSLAATLASLRDADEVVLVCDERRGSIALPALLDNVVVEHVTGHGDKGYIARERGMDVASGTHLAFCDDDDVFAPEAITLMRESACERPVIFRMDHPEYGLLWREPVLVFGNVGTPMLLVPNDPDKLGSWVPHAEGLPQPGGDFTFIQGCVEKMGEPLWREEVVAIVRPGRSIAVVTPWLDHLELVNDYFTAVSVLNQRDQLIIIDNASDPALQFAVVRSETNLGFSAASNLGLRRATTDAILFLNNDVVATSPDWLERIRSALEPGVLVGPMLRFDAHGQVDGYPLPYLDGWCLAGMREDLLELDGFDEDFLEPSYYSDNDLCLRARASGMALREVRTSIGHKVGATAGAGQSKLDAIAHNFPLFAARARELLAA